MENEIYIGKLHQTERSSVSEMGFNLWNIGNNEPGM